MTEQSVSRNQMAVYEHRLSIAEATIRRLAEALDRMTVERDEAMARFNRSVRELDEVTGAFSSTRGKP